MKKFQHSASANSAVEKARAFFRSLELKHLGGSSSSEQSSSRRRTTTNNNTISKVSQPSSISSSSSSSIIDDSHNTISTTTTNDSSFNQKNPSNCIATARIIRVINPNYSNPNDMIVQRVIHNQPDDQQLASSYYNFQKVLSQNSLPPPPPSASKQYFNERSQSYSVSFEKNGEIQTCYGKIQLFEKYLL